VVEKVRELAGQSGWIIEEAGPEPEVAVEATWGWYWAADLIADMGGTVHLGHPLAIKGYENRRVKNDLADATLLADLLRMNRLPEAWIAPDSIRQLRELVRYRQLSQMCSGLKGQIHSVMGKEAIIPTLVELWGPAGTAYLDSLDMGDAYALRVDSLRDLVDIFDDEIRQLEKRIHQRLKEDTGYRVVQQLNGVGRVHAAVFVAEIGDVHRFPNARKLCSWAGLTPKVKESDLKSYPQSISKQGSRLVRWWAVEAVSRYHGGAEIRDLYQRVAERRGRNIGKVAAARKLLTLVYYGLRDGEIRCLRDAA
jgi:transposase